MSFLDKVGITSSKGVFRTIASILATAAALPLPFLDPYRDTIIMLAGLFGGTGVGKSIVMGGGK